MRGDSHKRSRIVAITDEGRVALAKVFPASIKAVKTHLFESLNAANMEMLARVMTQVDGRLRAASPRSAAPRARRQRIFGRLLRT